MNKLVNISAFLLIALLLTACGMGGPSSNRAQTERLRGAWMFSHPSASPSQMSVELVGELEAFPGEPNVFYTYGLVNSNTRALAWYDVEYEAYVLGYSDGNKNHVYVFNFFESNRADGCYVQGSGDTSSDCMYAEGTHTPMSAQSISTQGTPPSNVANLLKAYREVREK